ncbi:protein CMSS1 [Garra rufa]|uniref:protein CMSS1 n=1 Tax=Garra rufa TaxID=137080 RepID=UPI003CCE734D
MADDLGDEWWTQGDNSEKEENAESLTEEQPNKSKSKKRKGEKQIQDNTKIKKKKKKETVQKECFITQERSEEKGDKESNKKRKRRKKKTITDVLTSSEPVAGTPADLMSLLKSHLSKTRSVIELDDMALSESCFLSCNDLSHSLSSYLKEVCPKWAKIQKKHTQTRSVVLLIVCGSALRAIDLIKQLTAFKGDAKVMKLFGKHMKLEDQIKFLSKGVIHIAVGTPGRISALLEKEGLTTQGLQYLVLDWNYRDQKQRKMVDMTEVTLIYMLLSDGTDLYMIALQRFVVFKVFKEL